MVLPALLSIPRMPLFPNSLYLLRNNSLFISSHLPAHDSAFHLRELIFHVSVQSNTSCPLVLISYSTMLPRVTCIITSIRIPFFYRLSNIPSPAWSTFCLSVHLSMCILTSLTFSFLPDKRWDSDKHPLLDSGSLVYSCPWTVVAQG